ncbi:hypothetical protein N7475_005527 [Penicillium sp. IBT 31633x]|nr:hypothetical protein N7475_005527 [Penicillium sp. IBT 31633x]
MWETTVTTSVSRRKSTLRLAAEAGHIPCVDYTLSIGEYQDLDAKQYMHKIGLIVPATVANGHIECAMFLLSHSGILERAQFCRCGKKPATALACDLPKLSMILKDPCIMEKYSHMLLYLAAVTGCSPLFEELVRLGVHPDTRFRGGNTPLCLAIIEERGAEDIKQLLALGAGVNETNSQNRTPLYLATVFRSKSVIKVLLDGGADLEACGYRSGMLQTPLFRAVDDFGRNAPCLSRMRRGLRSQSNELVSLLLKHGANPNYADPRSGITPLWLAVRGELALRKFTRHELVELLLEHGADPKLATMDQSLLFWAIPFHRYDTIKILLDYGADPNDYSRNFDGSITHYSGKALSPLARAMQLGHYGTAELLLDNGADAHSPYWKKETSLVNATKSMNCSFIRKMIDTGFDVNESVKGQTALHMAVWKGNVEVAELLLRHGANPNIVIGGTSCSSTRSILDWAIHRNYKAMVELLCAYGARRLDDTW